MTTREKIENVVYTRRDDVDLCLDLHLPAGPGPFPVVLGMPGGGWRKWLPKALLFGGLTEIVFRQSDHHVGDQGFSELRNKIHGRPEPGDAERVRAYAKSKAWANKPNGTAAPGATWPGKCWVSLPTWAAFGPTRTPWSFAPSSVVGIRF